MIADAPLSPDIRAVLLRLRADGTIEITGNALVPLHDWHSATYSANVRWHNARIEIPGSSLTVDKGNAELQLTSVPNAGTHLIVKTLEARCGATLLDLDGGEFATAVDGSGWQVKELVGRLDVGGGVAILDRQRLRGRFVFTGEARGPARIAPNATALSVIQHKVVMYPRDAAIQPPNFAAALTRINGGPIVLADGMIRFENISANYGADKILLNQAHLTLDDPRQKIHLADLRRQVRIEGMTGLLVCQQPAPRYPGGLGNVLGQSPTFRKFFDRAGKLVCR